MENDDQLSDEVQFPWEDIEAARKNHVLQRQHPASIARQRYSLPAKACPQCETTAEHLDWFYFQSPAETWDAHCGQAGWMTVCDKCRLQVDFILEFVA